MKSSIVCGVDGSPDSVAALTIARTLAQRLDARVILANVVEYSHAPFVGAGPMGAGFARPMPLTTTADAEATAAQLLEELATEAGLDDAEQHVLTGLAAERLAELADDEHAELIVVGSRGRGAFKAAFLGSVSTSLIGIARCPVLVVPHRSAAD